MLSGRVRQRDDNLSVSVELINTSDNSHLWGEEYNRKLTDALAVQNEIAQEITERLRLRLTTQQKARLSVRQTANAEAYQLYLKGRYSTVQFTSDGLKRALDYFTQAIALDPSYALAYDGISYAYGLADDVLLPSNEAGPKAVEAGRKAVELDDSLAEAHADLANALFVYSYDWDAAEREFRRAIAINPSYAPAYELSGWFLVVVPGRFEEGIAQARRSVALDPLNPEMFSVLAWDLYFARHHEEAISEARKCIDLHPDYWATYYYASQAYLATGRFAEADAALEKARTLIGDQVWVPLSQLAVAYVMSGEKGKARAALDELLALRTRNYVPAALMAQVYAALGDKDRAISELEQAYSARSLWMVFLKAEPQYDSLRSDPRFQALLRRMKFP